MLVCLNGEKMDIQDYKFLVKKCKISVVVEEGFKVVFTPYHAKDNMRLQKILNEIMPQNGFLDISDWQIIANEKKNEFLQLQKLEKLKRDAALKKLQQTPAADLMALNSEEKLKLLDTLFLDTYASVDENKRPITLNRRENIDLVQNNQEKLTALLFDMPFEKEFIADEIKKLKRFANLVMQIPNIKTDLEQYPSLKNAKKLKIANDVAEIFEYVYETKGIKIKPFTEEEYKKQYPDDKKIIPTGYATSDKTIYLNMDRLKRSDNLALLSMVFHEALHIYQSEHSFEQYPVASKMFDDKFAYLSAVQDGTYLLNHVEQHTYGMQHMFVDILRYDSQIKYIPNAYSAEESKKINDLREKAKISFDYKLAHHQTKI